MINLHIVRGVVRNDSRVLKEACTLRDSGMFDEVRIVGLNEPGMPEHEVIQGLPVSRISLRSRSLSRGFASQAFKFLEWGERIVKAHASMPLGVIHCHDLDPLPIGVRLKAATGARLVYDAHELETEQGERSKLRIAAAKWAERRFIRRADAMITVSRSIADWYAATYPGVTPTVVRNVPERLQQAADPVDLRSRFQVPQEAVLFLYLGALSHGRGIRQLLQAFTADGVPHHLVFMGSGQLVAEVTTAERADRRIHYLPPVPPEQVLRYAGGADVGVSMIEDTCLSNRYCLPNKLFESLAAGLAVLVSDLPEQRRVVDAYQAGWCVPPESEAIGALLRGLSRDDCARLRAGVAQRTASLDWESEAGVLLHLYRRVTGRPGAA